jgi:hypothetical protein
MMSVILAAAHSLELVLLRLDYLVIVDTECRQTNYCTHLRFLLPLLLIVLNDTC